MRTVASSRSDLAAKTLKVADLQPHQLAHRRQPLSNKRTRRMKDEAAVRGTRNPAIAIHKLPGWVRGGTILRKTIEDHMCARPDVVASVVKSIQDAKSSITDEIIDELAGKVREAIAARHSRKGTKSHWRAAIVEAAVRSAGGPDRPLAEWLESGAPTGVACDVETAGIFPSAGPKGASYEDIRRSWAQAEPLVNYASVEEHEKLVQTWAEMLSCQKWQLL